LHGLERVTRRRHATARAGHLGHAGDADERVHRADRLLAAEDLADQLATHNERRAGGLVIYARWLEDDALVSPAHRPVDLPHQLAAPVLGQQYGLGVPALAGVGHLRRLVVIAGDGREIAVADRAVRLVREVAGARRAVVLAGGSGSLGRGGGRLGFFRARAGRRGRHRPGGPRPGPAEEPAGSRARAPPEG